MSQTHIIVDSLNMFFRCTHAVSPAAGVDAMCGMALHTIFSSTRKAWRNFNGDHLIFALEGRNNWRKEFYKKYKLNRKIARLAQSETERENGEILLGAFGEMCDFLDQKTNVTTIQNNNAEADDMIAIWVQTHPNDTHVIISSDSDYVQLLKHPNVVIYNGVTGVIMKQDGLYDEKGRKLEFSVKSDGKFKVGKPSLGFIAPDNWYDFAMFLKKIRGDKSDNIFSAFPGARLKGTKNKVGITEAYEDREGKGFKWNNFMLQRWVDEEDNENIVKDVYARNDKLIDLELQPDDIRSGCIESMMESIDKEPVGNVGIHFLRFCGVHGLNRLSDSAQDFSAILNARYIKTE